MVGSLGGSCEVFPKKNGFGPWEWPIHPQGPLGWQKPPHTDHWGWLLALGVDRPPPWAKTSATPNGRMGWQTPMALGGGSATPNDQTHFFGPWGWPIHPPRAKGWLRPLEIGSLGWPKPPLCYTGVAGHPLYFFKFFFFF
jgi:hypothetical protein